MIMPYHHITHLKLSLNHIPTYGIQFCYIHYDHIIGISPGISSVPLVTWYGVSFRRSQHDSEPRRRLPRTRAERGIGHGGVPQPWDIMAGKNRWLCVTDCKCTILRLLIVILLTISYHTRQIYQDLYSTRRIRRLFFSEMGAEASVGPQTKTA